VEVSNKKILVVDSEKVIRQLLAKKFTLLGYSIFLASNGEEALIVFNRERPHLIILDVLLPKSDGYEVCRRIREDSKTPIIVLSSRGGVLDRIICFEIGADDYLTKPFFS
jgi:DNA-binding response OmpR family regulator